MRVYKTKGVIIKRSDFMESDRLLSVFSQDYGKIKVIAKGIKKPLSRLAGNLELFYEVELVISKGKNLDILSSVNLVKRHRIIYEDKNVMTVVYCMSELVYNLLGEKEENYQVYKTFCSVLKNINSKNCFEILTLFELKMYALLGYLPEMNSCAVCQKKLVEQKNYFDYEKGGIVCNDCGANKDEINADTIKILRLIHGAKIDFLARLKYDDRTKERLKKVVEKIREEVLQKEIKSMCYVLG